MKNKKGIQELISMTGFLSIFVFYTMRHASIDVKIAISGITTIIFLAAFVCTICISKYRKAAGMAFVGVLLGIALIFGTYLEFKNINNGFYIIILLLLFISIAIVSYRTAVKSGDIEAIERVKKNVIKFFICIGLLILLIAGLFIYDSLTKV